MTSVGELVDSGEAELTTGPFGTQLKASEYTTKGTPVINVRNIGFGSVREEADLEFVGEGTVHRLSRHVLDEGDIVFGREGAVERHAYIARAQAGWLQGSDCLRLRIKRGRFAPRFVSYVLLTDRHRDWIQAQCSHGATMASLNQGVLSRIELPDYPISVQHRVLGILSAFDDLIENNNRRIKILEEMAQRIYREWFVDFRYPGHEGVPLADSELGPIPEGWCLQHLVDIAEITMGQSPPSRFYNRKEEGLPFHQGVGSYGVHFPRHHVFSSQGSRIADDGDVLVSVRAPVGRINVADRKLILGRGLAAIRSFDGRQAYLLFLLKHIFAVEDSMGGGTIFQSVTKADMQNIRVVSPQDQLRHQFDSIANPMVLLIRSLTRSTELLRETRDLLLPRLISGEIDVEHLNIPTDEVAA